MIESIHKDKIDKKIEQYVNGELSEKQIESLWAELIRDDHHIDYLKSVANLKQLIQEKKRKKRKAKKRKYWSYSTAAAILLLVTALFVFDFLQPTSDTEIQPIDQIELDYYRSAEGTITDQEDPQLVREAIEMANTGQFNKAVTMLEEELQSAEDPQWISELNLNLGSLHYNEGNYQEAMTYFDSVLELDEESVTVLNREKAHWYIGNVYFQMDELESARHHIEEAYELNGAYRRVAQSYLNALSAR